MTIIQGLSAEETRTILLTIADQLPVIYIPDEQGFSWGQAFICLNDAKDLFSSWVDDRMASWFETPATVDRHQWEHAALHLLLCHQPATAIRTLLPQPIEEVMDIFNLDIEDIVEPRSIFQERFIGDEDEGEFACGQEKQFPQPRKRPVRPLKMFANRRTPQPP